MVNERLRMAKPVRKIKKQLNTFEEIQDAMLAAGKIMNAFSLVEAYGHISARLPGTSTFLMTSHRHYLHELEANDLVVVDAEGKDIKGDAGSFREKYLHFGIYRNRPEIGAICRFHSEMTSAFGVAKRNIRVVHAFGYLLGPEVQVLDTPMLGTSPEVAKLVADMDLTDSYGLIFRGNGAVTFGTNIIDACVRAIILDESARIQFKASLLGNPIYLTMDEINRRNADYDEMSAAIGGAGYDPYFIMWNYYKAKADKLLG